MNRSISGYEFGFVCDCDESPDGVTWSFEIDGRVDDGEVVTCPDCNRSFEVSIDEVDGGDK